jgi:hypothetical protein
MGATTQAPHKLTIGVVRSTSTPRQDVVGVCLHCSTAVSSLASAQPCRIVVGMPVFCDCNLGERMYCGGAGEEEQVSGMGGGGAHGVGCEVVVARTFNGVPRRELLVVSVCLEEWCL